MVPKGINYIKLSDVKASKQKEYNVYGFIMEISKKRSYDRQGVEQDEHRIKLKDDSMEESIDVTAYTQPGKIPQSAFVVGRIARFHRLHKNYFKQQETFYLGGRIGTMSSVLLFDIPLKKVTSEFRPSYASSVNYSYTSKDDEMINHLISKADDILQSHEEEGIPESPPQELRRSPRKHNTPAPSRAVNFDLNHEASTVELTTPHRPSTRSSSKSPLKAVRINSNAAVTIVEPEPIASIEESVEECAARVEEPVGPLEESVEKSLVEEPVAPANEPEDQPIQENGDAQPVSAIRTSPLQRIPSSPKKARDCFIEIKDMLPGNKNYFNVLCQVVSCYTGFKMNSCLLRVWDGTVNPTCKLMQRFKQQPIIYGNVEREEAIAAQNKLYEIACWDEHCCDAANFSPGDYIALVNLHFFAPNKCASLVMHSGDGCLINERNQMVSAGRKIVKVTEDISPTAFHAIDHLIRTHEAGLPPVTAQTQSVGKDIGDADWQAFLGIPENQASTSAPIQPSSPTLNGFSQSQDRQQIAIQTSPNRNTQVAVSSLAGSSFYHSSAPLSSQINQNQPYDQAPTSAVFARRPPRMIIPGTPPAPKRLCTQNNFQATQDSISTQAFLDKLKPMTQVIENDVGSLDEEEYPTISETQIENMWAEVYAGMLNDTA